MKKYLKIFAVFSVLLSIVGCSCTKPIGSTNKTTTTTSNTTSSTTTSTTTVNTTSNISSNEDK